MTALGLLLLPACLLACLRPIALLQLVLICSVFEAAAAVALGGLGLQPAMLPSATFAAFMVLQALLGARYAGEREIWWPQIPMTLFTVWALVTSVLLPNVLEGQVYVYPQKLEPPFAAVLLNPQVTSLNPDIYLFVDCTMLVLTSWFASGSTVRSVKVLNGYIASGYLAVGIGLWQLANKVAGVPFPDSFFYSNPGWAILSTQQVSAIPRINGSFAEPSAYSAYLVSVVCCTGWMALNGRTKLSVRILLWSALIMVLLSTSTTGYGVLAIVAVGVPIYALLRGSSRLQMQVIRLSVVIAVAVTVIGLTTTAFFPKFNQAVHEITASTLEKPDSDSYRERSAADSDSLELAVHTFGLGTGWGSNRASSLIPGILSNVGVLGALLLVWFAVSVVRLVNRACRVMRDPDDWLVIRGATGMVLGTLAAALLSGPSITSVTFFTMIGLLIGVSGRTLVRARAAGSSQRRGQRAGALVVGSR